MDHPGHGRGSGCACGSGRLSGSGGRHSLRVEQIILTCLQEDPKTGKNCRNANEGWRLTLYSK